MNLAFPQLNLVFAWLWMLLGFLSGMALGMGFHKEGFLGGYNSLQRRLYRLGHIACFALGALNLMFFLTVTALDVQNTPLKVAGYGFIVGAVSMPVCCVLMAHWPRLHLLFAVPVISLLIGGTLTLLEVVKL